MVSFEIRGAPHPPAERQSSSLREGWVGVSRNASWLNKMKEGKVSPLSSVVLNIACLWEPSHPLLIPFRPCSQHVVSSIVGLV